MSHHRIIELFDESTNQEQDEHLSLLSGMEDLSLLSQQEQPQTPSEDYTVYIGRPHKPYFDINDRYTLIVPRWSGVRGNMLILHGTMTHTCMWIWISERQDEESGEVVLKKGVARFLRCPYRCDTLVEKKEVGVLRAAECERFDRIVEETSACKGTTFVFEVLEACSGEGVLGEEGVRNAFFDLRVSSMRF
ncbi:hypothetical protein ASPVEDRAFT_86953 [Aspergillus versicolor CBS 583.65]|uniref:Uncharacterized protein n=1 Tax=Aspergillus versicolor CBS 583.65 TaxID=1036611 RepID=A0A1L9PVN6_ASPVE|nr:uncharacterized protein ASPVEDRAFT_86953 [Aspergillus versicolor CBS 583.65]OJJ05609.1 hypothetical protein ASPVEDRAFT_86953 [Aspergillus versicolor CBS 583.65]